MKEKRILGRPKKYMKAKSNSFYVSKECQERIDRFSEELNLSKSGVLELLTRFGNANYTNVKAYKENQK